MHATITVKKSELRDKLEARITEVYKEFNSDPSVIELRDAIEAFETGEDAETFTRRTLEYHRAIAEGIESNSIQVKANGKLSGEVPIKPVKNKVQARYFNWSKDYIKRQLEYKERRLKVQIKPLTVALELLDLSTEETIQIDSADYHKLLSGEHN